MECSNFVVIQAIMSNSNELFTEKKLIKCLPYSQSDCTTPHSWRCCEESTRWNIFWQFNGSCLKTWYHWRGDSSFQCFPGKFYHAPHHPRPTPDQAIDGTRTNHSPPPRLNVFFCLAYLNWLYFWFWVICYIYGLVENYTNWEGKPAETRMPYSKYLILKMHN